MGTKDDPVVIVLRPSDLIPKIELPNLELPHLGFPDGFPMLPPEFGKVEIPRVDLGIFGRAATEDEGDCGIVCQSSDASNSRPAAGSCSPSDCRHQSKDR